MASLLDLLRQLGQQKKPSDMAKKRPTGTPQERIAHYDAIINKPTGVHAASVAEKLKAREARRRAYLNSL